MGYPLVRITNSTNYFAYGKIVYRSTWCSDDYYTVFPHTSWEAKRRGACLVTRIWAGLRDTPAGDNREATPYTSSGTSYSQFEIIQTSDNPLAFAVVRRGGSAADDEQPADYEEPTTRQKD